MYWNKSIGSINETARFLPYFFTSLEAENFLIATEVFFFNPLSAVQIHNIFAGLILYSIPFDQMKAYSAAYAVHICTL